MCLPHHRLLRIETGRDRCQSEFQDGCRVKSMHPSSWRDHMITKGLLVRMEARPGMDAEVEKFLQSALPLVQKEPATAAWFAIRFGRSEYGIFDVFPDEEGREAHLNGPVAKALMEQAAPLFVKQPTIHRLSVLASKLPSATPAAPDTK